MPAMFADRDPLIAPDAASIGLVFHPDLAVGQCEYMVSARCPAHMFDACIHMIEVRGRIFGLLAESRLSLVLWRRRRYGLL